MVPEDALRTRLAAGATARRRPPLAPLVLSIPEVDPRCSEEVLDRQDAWKVD